jgi:hypothetical protein
MTYTKAMPTKTLRQAQITLKNVTDQLLRLEDLLLRLKARLPVGPNVEAMLEGCVPYDVATDLIGSIECVVDDCLRPAIRTLGKASVVTAEELASEFWKSHRSG